MTHRQILPLLRGLMIDPRGRAPRLTLGRPDTQHPTLPVKREQLSQAPLETLRPAIESLPQDCAGFILPDLGPIEVSRSTGTGRTSGKVALVTGAARGFGFEIAAALVEQGAFVVLADINAEGIEQAARSLNEKSERLVALGVVMDVTKAASVDAAVSRLVTTCGGLDLLVANAGVVKAGGVMEQAPEDFDRVTRVNYTGYFHCVHAVAPIMARQHQACPERWFDIIQINSKSGLEGSNKNGAYAGSKFGGIGLTQSFALELVAHGIKVNAICPGNFLDGPLWSDPENGLFAQYLKSGKVPGARNVQDVRRAYETKVPMGRGCTTSDVMKALYYLLEQEYETGQALPVTGGQVMLH